LWQLGAISTRPPVREAAELIIGNLSEDGYLIASDDELLGVVPAAAPEADAETQAKIVGQAEALGIGATAASELPQPDQALPLDALSAGFPGLPENGQAAHPMVDATLDEAAGAAAFESKP